MIAIMLFLANILCIAIRWDEQDALLVFNAVAAALIIVCFVVEEY